MNGIYTAISAASEGQTVTQIQASAYSFGATPPSPLTLPGIVGLGGYSLGIISFVDVLAGSASSAGLWVKDTNDSLDKLFSVVDRAKVLVGVVFYKSSGPMLPSDYSGFLPASCTLNNGFFRAYVSPYYTSATVYSLAYRLFSGLDGTVTQPFTYVLDWSTGLILDKVHRQSEYSGEASYAASEDLFRLGWDASAASNQTMYEYLLWRISDHLAASRSLSVLPTDADNRLGGHPRVMSGSKISCSFSQKARGLSSAAGLSAPASWVFSDGASDLAGPLVDPGHYDVSWGGYSSLHDEDIEKTVLAPTAGATLTLKSPSTGLLDARGNGFTSSAAFVVDGAGDLPACAMSLSDGASSVDLMAAGSVPTWTLSSRLLTVEVKTAYPTAAQPTGRVVKPDGTTAIALGFAHYAASLDAGLLDTDGVYTVEVDAFRNNAGQTMAKAVRRFIIAENIAGGNAVRALEGWGWYPREEGLPGSAAESGLSGLHGDTGWVGEGAAGVPAPVLGSRLACGVVGVGLSWRRDYSSAFGTDGDDSSSGNGCAYAEAGFVIASAPTGSPSSVYDSAGNALQLRIIGAGLEVWNGPLKLSVLVVDSGVGTTPRLAVRSLGDGYDRYKVTSIAIETGKLHLIRAEYDAATKGYILRHSSYGLTGPAPAVPVVWSDNLAIAQDELYTVPGGPYTAGLRFGALSVSTQSYSLEWEFVRYGFYDGNWAASSGSTSLVGIVHTQRAGETAYYRSGDIKIGGLAQGEPVDGLANDVAAVLVSGSLPSLTDGIPFKVRFFAVDWSESATSLAGFSASGFRPCYSSAAPGFAPFPAVAGAACAAKAGRAALSSVGFDVATKWSFDVKRSDLGRRLFLLAYVDSPLMPTPPLLPFVPIASLLVGDSAAKADYRCAVRQFLPDFYVRDVESDRGESPGGSLSPDLAMATFAGSISGGVHQLPNPQGLAESTYPKAFASGQPSPFDYTPSGVVPIASTDPTKAINLTDTAWSDLDGPPAQCFYNRVWVRLSNRGVVPGPAAVQVSFLGSTLRAAFDPVAARVPAYGAIYADQACTKRVQTLFQLYDRATGALQLPLVGAIPALSGASDPGASVPGAFYTFVIAEFLWHVAEANLPATDADKHGCRAACINLPKPAAATDTETWSTGIDEAPSLASPFPSIWSVNSGSNNVTVRNSNLVQAVPSDAGHVSLKLHIRGAVPVGYRKLPNDFVQTFGRTRTVWGLSLDARRFADGDLVLRVDARAFSGVTVRGFVEAFDEVGGHAESAYRFFSLRGGGVGTLTGNKPAFKDGRAAPDPVSVFYLLGAEARGRYEIVLGQIAGGAMVGSYRTVVMACAIKDIGFAADDRYGIAYDVRTDPGKLKTIPYEHLSVFTGPGMAVQEGFRLTPATTLDFITGKLANEVANIPKGFVYPKPPESIPAYHEGLEGVVQGQVLDQAGIGMAGCQVSLQDSLHGLALGNAVTDQFGNYAISIKAVEGRIRMSTRGKRSLAIEVRLPEKMAGPGGKAVLRRKLAARDLCFIADPITVKRPSIRRERT